MNIQSKYQGGEIVYIVNYVNGRIKFQQAHIMNIAAWEQHVGFMYDAKFTTADGVEYKTRIHENEIYLSKEEILTDLILDDYTNEEQEENDIVLNSELNENQ